MLGMDYCEHGRPCHMPHCINLQAHNLITYLLKNIVVICGTGIKLQYSLAHN